MPWEFRERQPLSGVLSSAVQPAQPYEEEIAMNWDRIEGNWKEFMGKAKQQWVKLTADDLTQIRGRRDDLRGRLQRHYGYGKDQAEREIDTWTSRSGM